MGLMLPPADCHICQSCQCRVTVTYAGQSLSSRSLSLPQELWDCFETLSCPPQRGRGNNSFCPDSLWACPPAVHPGQSQLRMLGV